MKRCGRIPRFLAWAVAVATAVALPAACSTATSPSTSAATGSGATHKAATRTVVDMVGRSVQIPDHVTRVATNYPALPTTLYLLGDIHDLVGATPMSFDPLFKTIDPAVATIPDPFPAASSVNTEALLATHPQVVLLSPAGAAFIPTLTRLHIPVLEFSAFQSAAALEAGTQLLARVFGGPAISRAAAYTAYFRANIAKVTAKTAGLPAASRPSVFYATQGPTTTEGTGSIVTTWIEQGGGVSVAAAHGVGPIKGATFPSVSVETLLRWNPQYIVTLGAPLAHTFETSPQYAALAAVRNHHVYPTPAGVFPWSVRSVESALQPLWIARTLHPALFTSLDLAASVRAFYKRFYSYSLSASQVNAILAGTY